MSKLDMRYDEANDIATIEGVKYSGEFFRAFAVPCPYQDTVITITHDEHGVVVIHKLVGISLQEIEELVNAPS